MERRRSNLQKGVFWMNIAEKLIELRNEKGLTQAQLGRELNIALSSIQNYENIKKPRIPEATLLLKIAKYFDVDMEYLLDDELNNRKHDNIVIERELGLSDKAIKNLKGISNKTMKRRINFLLGDIETLAKVLQTIEIWEDKRWKKMKKS